MLFVQSFSEQIIQQYTFVHTYSEDETFEK